MELNVEKFNPDIAELTALANEYKALTIDGVDDKEGYQRVHKAQMDLRDKRVAIKELGKAMREKALAYQKQVIKEENALVAITEPVEDELRAKKEVIDLEIEKRKRIALLPERKEKMATVGIIPNDDDLLGMSPEAFQIYFNNAKEDWLMEKEAILEAEQERIDNEKRQAEEAKMAEARKAEEAKLEAEREAQRQRDIEEAKAQAILAENARIAREANEKAEREAKEQAEFEGKRKYQSFLKKHEVTAETIDAGLHQISRKPDGTIVLYKKVDSISI